MTVTLRQLVSDLKALGVTKGGTVMMHSSLSALGPVEGGAEVVIDAVFGAIGSEGTLLVPAFRDGGTGIPSDFSNTDCDCLTPDGLCSSRQPGFQGVIPETVRRRPGNIRSCHPTHSWVGLGPAARNLLREHRSSPTPCGPGNPFEKMAPDDCVLLLGVGMDRVTLWHYYEERVGVPYRGHYQPKERHITYSVAGKRLQYEYPGILEDVCRAAGILQTGPIGKSKSGIMRVGQFKRFLSTIIANDPYCMVLRPPDRLSDNLIIDALRKAEGMLDAWRRGPEDPCDYFVAPRQVEVPGEDDTVRADCPAFAGYCEDDGREISLCRANHRHPDLEGSGGLFSKFGVTTCSDCSWHLNFPLMSDQSAGHARRRPR